MAIEGNKFVFEVKRLGVIGEKKSKNGKNRHFYGFFARFRAIFGVLQRTLTPSFVGSNPATPATDTIYCIRLSKSNTIYGFCFFCGFFLPFDCGEDCGVIAG